MMHVDVVCYAVLAALARSNQKPSGKIVTSRSAHAINLVEILVINAVTRTLMRTARTKMTRRARGVRILNYIVHLQQFNVTSVLLFGQT